VATRKPADPRSLRGDGTSPGEAAVIRNLQPRGNYTVRETSVITSISNGNALPTFGATAFWLGMLPNYSAFTAIFDRYRFLRFEVLFAPYVNQVNDSTSVSLPQLHTCLDYDDQVVPTTVDFIRRCGTYAGVQGNKPLKRCFLPRASAALYDGITTAYAEVAPMVWLDCAYTTIPHFGIKYAIDAASTAGMFRYNIELTATVEFSGRR